MTENLTRTLIGAGALLAGIGVNEYRHNQSDEPAGIESEVTTTTNPNQILLPPTTVAGLGVVAVPTTVLIERSVYGNLVTCEGSKKDVIVMPEDAFPENIPGTGSVLRAMDRTVFGSYPVLFSNIQNPDSAIAVARDAMVQGGINMTTIDTNIEINNVPIGTTFKMTAGICR